MGTTTPPGSPAGADPTFVDPPSLILDRYRVDAILGHGGFGDVVRAYDTRIRRVVAIKTLRPAVAVQYPGEFMGLRERFEREAEASSRMGVHPNVVAVYDFAADADGTLYLIMEYAPGGTLTSRIEHGPLTLREALRLTADAARGLDAAHRQGIVHRDVKPANLFLTAEGRAKVGDFGIAQIDDLSQRSRLAVHHPGTPLYMSPEQERETGYLRAVSDEYSLGLVLYEMLTGKKYKALEPREAWALLEWHARAAVPLVQRMTAEATGDRYPSLAAVVEAIEAVEANLNRGDATIVDPVPFTTPQQSENERPAAPARTEVTPSQSPGWPPSGAQSWPAAGYTGAPPVAPVTPSGPASWPLPPAPGVATGYASGYPAWQGVPPAPPTSARGGKWALALASLPLVYVLALGGRHTLDGFSVAILMAPYLVTLLFLLLIPASPAPSREERTALLICGLLPICIVAALLVPKGHNPSEGLVFLAPTTVSTVVLLFALTNVVPGGARAVIGGLLIGLLASLTIGAAALAWSDALGPANPSGSGPVIALQFLLILLFFMIPQILVLIVAAVQRRRRARMMTGAYMQYPSSP